MRKLTLKLEALAVQSFETTPADEAARGTVLGRNGMNVGVGAMPRDTYPNGCPSPLCVDTPMASCDGSCVDTCYDSCAGSCASCGGTCNQTCPASCAPSYGPLCVPPTDPAVAHPRY